MPLKSAQLLMYAFVFLAGSAMAAPGVPTEAKIDEVPLGTLAAEEWRARSTLQAQQLQGLPEFCAGRYVDQDYPQRAAIEALDRSKLPIHARAGHLTYWESGKAILEDNVSIQQGNVSIQSSTAIFLEKERQVLLPDTVKIRQPGVVMRGKKGEVNLDRKTARLEDAEFVLFESEIRGVSELVEQTEIGDLRLRQNTFTRCEPGNNNWSLDSKSLLIEDGSIYGVARSAVLRVKNVPIFYTPYIRFPVTDDRQSGFLFPSFAYSGEDGLDLSIPYYLNLAPDYDATLTPRFISKRGFGLEAEFRHLADWAETELGGAYLYQDDLFNGELSRKDYAAQNPSGDFNPVDRWLLNIDHRGQLGKFTTLVDYSRVSDDEYFRDLGSDLSVSSRVQLERRAELRYRNAGLSARLWAQAFQNLDALRPNSYQRLPELELSWRKRFGKTRFRLVTEWASFDRDNINFTGLDRIVGERMHIEPRLELPLNWRAGFVKFAAAYKYTSYKLKDTPESFTDTPDRSIAMGSVDGGLYFDRNITLFGINMLQTLEPRVFYLYQEFANQDQLPRFDSSQLTFGYNQLYRENRFTGLDRLGDANQVSLGLSTRFMGAANGREYLRASVGRITYLKNRRVSLNTLQSQAGDEENTRGSSALAGELSARLGARWRVGASLVWDSKNSEVDESNFYLQYKRDARRILNLGYRSRDLASDIKQVDASAYWALSKNWGLIARYNYDLEFNRTIETFAGLEYNDCCWRVRVLARKYIDNPSNRPIADLETDRGVFFQVVFKGLAGFGGKIDTIMENGIRGFRRRQ